MQRLLGVFITLIITGFISNTFGQGNCNQGFTDYNWYFGDQGRGVQFSKNQSMAEFVPTATLNRGGTAVASDPSTGTVLFYTDGQEVYDVTDTQMTNGGLPANVSGNQPVAICRNPAIQDQYFLFTNTANGAAVGTIQYTIIDMSLTGNAVFPKPALGAIDITQKNQGTGITNASEAMIVVPNANENGFWLIAHENGVANLIVMGISNAGVIQAPTSIPLGAITQAANISYHMATNRLAVTSQLNGENVEILDFNPATGTVTLNSTIANSGNVGTIYDAEWGYFGDILYLSREDGGAPDVFQYDLNNPGLTSILTNPIDKSFGLQLAPDSSIYHLYQATSGGDFLLARISNIDSLNTNQFFEYQDNLFNGRNTGANQFPVFLPPFQENYTLSFTPTSSCLNSAITFYPSLINNGTGANVTIDVAFWNFTEGQSNNIIPTFTFQDVATSSITLNAQSGSCFYSVTQAFTLTDFQLQISMTSDTTFCIEEFPPPRGTDGTASILANISGGTPTTINWFGPGGDTGQTNNTLMPDSAGYYYIVVTDATGCTAYQGVNVQEYGLQEQRANIWYFGQNAGIDFNQMPAVALSDSQMNAPEGCSAISDRNGQIVLYTDGVDVYDKQHNQITTSDLGGEQGATQSALIVPSTNDETRYYIFTTEEIYGTNTYQLKYSVFDLKLNNGVGDIVEQDVLLLSPSTERIAASTNWLITHEYGNNTFRTYPITVNGIGNPVFSNIGMDHATLFSQSGQGYMKLGANDLMIVALSDGINNYLELFDLDQATGILSNYRQIDLTADGASGQVYGVEISPGGNKIFAGVKNSTNSQIFEYYLDSLGDPQSLADNRFDSGLDLGAIQIAPDGQIYIAINNSGTLGTIIPNEDTTVVSSLNVVAAPFSLADGTQSRLGLPNFIQSLSSPALTPVMAIVNGCPGDSLNFTISGVSTIDEFRWNILNSNGGVVQTSSIQNPTFIVNTPDTYTANVFIYNRCDASPNLTLTLPFEVFAPPTFSLSSTNIIGSCGDDTGTYTIDVTSSAAFSYTTNDSFNSTGTNITGPVSIMIGSPTIGNGLVAGAYTITLTDDTNGCSDTQVITISDLVPYTVTASGLTDCADVNDGIVTIDFSSAPFNNNIIYTLTDEATNLIVFGHNNAAATVVANSFQITAINQGTYTVQITDADCNTFLSGIAVAPPAPYTLVIPADLTICDVTSVDLDITTNSPDIQITDPNSNISTLSLGGATSATITFNKEGLYLITALDASNPTNPANCPNAQPITITFNGVTPSPLNAQYIVCPDDPDPAVMTRTLNVGNQFISVRWFDDDNDLLQNGNGYTFAGDSIVVSVPGIIVAELTNPFGCITMDTISIVKDCQPRIVAPNAFRPTSGVSQNQNFSIYSLFLKEDAFEVYIYSRWGELVFQSEDLNFQWNGGYSNDLAKPLPLGTYAYILKYVDKNNEDRGVQEQRGGVLLIR